MLNKEKYKNELEDVLVKSLAVSKNGEIYRCKDIDQCEKCIFYGGDCVENTKKWLNAECKGTAMLTEEEKTYLSSVIKPFRDKVTGILIRIILAIFLIILFLIYIYDETREKSEEEIKDDWRRR